MSKTVKENFMDFAPLFPKTKTHEPKIFDGSGREIATQINPSLSGKFIIDTRDLANGLYILQYGEERRKFVKLSR